MVVILQRAEDDFCPARRLISPLLMPPGSWPKWARKRHARDFTAQSVIEEELRKKTHHGASLVRRALKKAKTFDEAKLVRRSRAPDADAERCQAMIEATKRVDIDDLAKRCAEAVRRRVEATVREAFESEAAAAGEASGASASAKRAVDLDDAVDAKDVLRNVCDEAASALAMNDVAGESEDVAAARRLLRAQATRVETEALKERLLAIAGRMNRAVVGKQKREEWAKEKAEREAKRAAEKAKAEEKAKRRAAGEEVSSSEDDEPESASGDESDGSDDNSKSDSEDDSDDVDEEGYVSLSEETMAELRAAKAAAKAAKKSKKGKSADEIEELDLQPKKKKVKKRMGQRKRRQIAEAKFGANAAHLIAEREKAEAERQAKEEEEKNMHPSWQAKRKQAPIIVPAAGKKVKFDEEGSRKPLKDGSRKPLVSHKSMSKKHDAPKTHKPKAPEKPLHPSWQAKLKSDELAWGGGGVKPQGKKVVFD